MRPHNTATTLLGLLCAQTVSAAPAEAQRVVTDFSGPDAEQNWYAVNDGVMGGVSDGRVRVTDDATLEFFGTLSLENNGGFASIRSQSAVTDLIAYDGLLIRVRGDGRRYSFTLRTDVPFIAGSYRQKFDTINGEWQEIFLPFTGFEATSFGRVLPDAPPLEPAKIRSFGFILADKNPGPFRLEVDFIRAETREPEATADVAKPSAADHRQAAVELITRAIDRGVPLFNGGRPDACAAVYELTAASIVRLAGDDLPSGAIDSLRDALDRAARTEDHTDRAWILRRGLDDAVRTLASSGHQ
jgi:monofunctional biosynthetic peptidoglycan transglycosylase